MSDAPQLPTVWRPRRGRIVPYLLAVVVLIGFVVVAVALTSKGRSGATPLDRGLLIGSGLLIAWVLHRYAAVRVVADERGITVVNLFRRRRLEWAEIVAVRLAPGDPWVQLDLSDGTTLPVMGIQATDGEHGRRCANGLGAAVAEHGG